MCRWQAVLLLVIPISLLGPMARAQGPALDRDGAALPEGAIARFGGMRFRHGDRVMTLAFAPDGKRLVSAGVYDGTVRIWEVATGREIRSFRGPTLNFESVALSADGNTLIAMPVPHFYEGHWPIGWDVATGKEIADLKLPAEYRQRSEGRVSRYAAFEGNRLVLARTSEARDFYLWRSASGKEVSFSGLGGNIHWLVFAADASVLGCVVGKELRLWDVPSGKEIRRCSLAKEIRPDFALSPGGKLLAEVTRESTVRLWDTVTGKPLRELKPDHGFVIQAAFAPDGKTLAVGTYEGLVRFLEVTSGKERTTVDGHEAAVSAVALAADGKTLATASFDRTVRLWDTATSKERRSWRPHHAGLACVALSADGKRVAAAGGKPDSKSDEGIFHLWDAASGGREVCPPWSTKRWGLAVAFSPNGKILATGSADGPPRLHDAAGGDELRRCQGKEQGYGPGVRALTFAPDGRVLASATLSGTLSLWEVATGRRRAHALQLAPSPHPHSAFAGFSGGHRDIRPLMHGPFAMFEAVAFAPDGQTLFTAGGVRLANSQKESWTIRCWETEALQEVRRFVAQPSHTYGVALSPDGRLLATGHEDGTLVFWDAASGKKRTMLTGHRGAVLAVAFAADGKTLATGSTDGTALLWDVALSLGVQPAAAATTAAQFARLWGWLRDEQSQGVQRAIRELTATPRETVAFLKERLRPVSPADPQHIAVLIADLDRNEFARRDRAMTELQKLDHLAAPALRQALADKKSLEFRQRVDQLLEKLKRWTPERLAELRALEVLERIGTKEARELLETVARGAPESPWTEEARAALERLRRRSPPKP